MTGKIIKCPGKIETNEVSIFLAGGITDCPDWQSIAERKIARHTDAVIYNSRRDSFDVNDPNASVEQINWEFNALRASTINLFWFPFQTLCPITLLEYGTALVRIDPKNLICGTHKIYKRKFDIEEQTKLMNDNIVYDDLDDVINEAINKLNSLIDK